LVSVQRPESTRAVVWVTRVWRSEPGEGEISEARTIVLEVVVKVRIGYNVDLGIVRRERYGVREGRRRDMVRFM
jgi:hypothetical protein